MSNRENSLQIYFQIQNVLEEEIERLNSNIETMKQIRSEMENFVGEKKEKMNELKRILREEIYHTVSVNLDRIDEIPQLNNSIIDPKKLAVLKGFAPKDYIRRFSEILKTANDIFKESTKKKIKIQKDNYIIYENGDIHFPGFNNVGVAAKTLGTKVKRKRKIKKKKSKKEKEKSKKKKK